MAIDELYLAKAAELARHYNGFTTEVWTRLQVFEMNREAKAMQKAYDDHLRNLASLETPLDRKIRSD